MTIAAMETSYTVSTLNGPQYGNAPNLYIKSGETEITTLYNGNKNIILDISNYDTITIGTTRSAAATQTVLLKDVVFKWN